MAGAAPDPSKVKGNAPTITTILCIVLAIVILIGVCIARKTNTLAAVREVATRTRSTLSGRRGLDSSTINSIPIVRYAGTDGRGNQPSSNDDCERGPRLETIHEDDGATDPRRDSPHDAARPNFARRIYVRLKRWEALVPKRPTPRLQKPHPERLSRQEETSCSICAEDFSDGTDLRKLPCGHLFHPRCIDAWLADFNVTCPLCRIDLSVSATVAALPPPHRVSFHRRNAV